MFAFFLTASPLEPRSLAGLGLCGGLRTGSPLHIRLVTVREPAHNPTRDLLTARMQLLILRTLTLANQFASQHYCLVTPTSHEQFQASFNTENLLINTVPVANAPGSAWYGDCRVLARQVKILGLAMNVIIDRITECHGSWRSWSQLHALVWNGKKREGKAKQIVEPWSSMSLAAFIDGLTLIESATRRLPATFSQPRVECKFVRTSCHGACKATSCSICAKPISSSRGHLQEQLARLSATSAYEATSSKAVFNSSRQGYV